MADEDKGDKGGGDAPELKDPRSVGHDDKGGEVTKPPPKPEPPPEKPKRKPVWPLLLAAAVVIGFVILVLVIIFAPHSDVRTDDAYVTAHYATVAPRVSGQVSAVYVNDNQPVRAGQLLATLDDRDYRTTLLNAQAQRASDQAKVDQAHAEVLRQPAVITQAQAQVASAQARLGLSRADQARYANLASTGAGTFQQHQQADTTLKQDQASLVQAEGELAAQRRQLAALVAEEDAAKAQVKADDARIAQAELNLSYTRLTAPLDGEIDQRTTQVGDYVSPGASLMVVTPRQAVYVLANYRELALRHMRPGQSVLIHLDAYNIDLRGVVDSIPPASGATYSPVPPNNATGNFTKIVQRLPVKIDVIPGQPLAKLLRVGMSVETTVHTDLADVVAAQRHDPNAWVTAR